MKRDYLDISTALTLKNVRLETGFEYDDDRNVVHTKTDLFTVEIEEGKVKRVHKDNGDAEGLDCKGYLLLPAFKDMHAHLDKSLFGLPWQAVLPRNKSVKDMIAYEQEIIPELLKTSIFRSGKLIEFLQCKGTDFARSHVNIDNTSKLDSLHHLEKALAQQKDFFDCELVAFPQHGLYYTPSAEYMKEAAQSENINFIGGLDPTSIDGSIEKPMDFTVQLALDNQKGIDIHLHETTKSGVETIEYLIRRVEENLELKGNTFISHCYVLGFLEEGKLNEIAERLAAAQIGIITTFPFVGFTIPYLILLKHGVDVRTGTDNIQDHWGTFGSGSVLQRANLAAQLYGLKNEFELSRAMGLATFNITPLDDEGNRQWPKVGDPGNMVLVDAECSAETVSRMPEIEVLIHGGEVVFATF